MKIKAYKSYGALAHELYPVYSLYAPASEIYDRCKIIVPDDIHVCKSVEDKWLVDINGSTYDFNELLTNVGDDPALIVPCAPPAHHKQIRLSAINIK